MGRSNSSTRSSHRSFVTGCASNPIGHQSTGRRDPRACEPFLLGRFDPRLSRRWSLAQLWSGPVSSARRGIRLAKSRKPATARKPPVPSDGHADIEDWIRHVMPDLHPIVERLDGSIRETIPGLRYAIKWKNAFYGLPELGWIIEMVAYDVSVNVVFLGGADFDLSSAAWNHGSEPLRQADDPGGCAGTGDPRVDRASGARAGLELRSPSR